MSSRVKSAGHRTVPFSDLYDFLAKTEEGKALAQRLLKKAMKRSSRVESLRRETTVGQIVRYSVIHEAQPPKHSSDPFEQTIDKRVRASPQDLWQLPTSIAEGLRHAKDQADLVHEDRVQSEAARSFLSDVLDEISAVGDAFHPELFKTDPFSYKYSLGEQETLRALASSVRLDNFADRMRTLPQITEEYGAPDAFHGLGVAALQHLFPTSDALLQELKSNGAVNVDLQGKPYSTDPRMYAKHGLLMHEIGLESYWTGRGELPSKDALAAAAAQTLSKLFKGVDPNGSQQFVILDEGGYLTRALNNPPFEQFAHLCVVIEQTQSGGDVVDELAAAGKLKSDVVAVWKSWLKKNFESPAIGENIVTQSAEQLAAAGVSLDDEPKTATLIGFGAVNSAVAASLLRKGFKPENITVVDPLPEALRAARKLGLVTTDPDKEVPLPLQRQAMLPKGHNVFIATGKRAIVPEDFFFMMPDARVMNGGSGNYEASADTEGFKELENAHIRKFGWNAYKQKYIMGGVFKPKMLLAGDREILVLRGGYVVNMETGLPPEFAQIPRGLMLGGSLQASRLLKSRPSRKRDDRPGRIIDLDDGFQTKLKGWLDDDLVARGQSLLSPDFDRLAPF